MVRVLSSTIQQLCLLLLDASSAPCLHGTQHFPPDMAATVGGSVESMSIAMASPMSIQQKMDVNSPLSVSTDVMPTGSACATLDEAAPGEDFQLSSCPKLAQEPYVYLIRLRKSSW